MGGTTQRAPKKPPSPLVVVVVVVAATAFDAAPETAIRHVIASSRSATPTPAGEAYRYRNSTLAPRGSLRETPGTAASATRRDLTVTDGAAPPTTTPTRTPTRGAIPGATHAIRSEFSHAAAIGPTDPNLHPSLGASGKDLPRSATSTPPSLGIDAGAADDASPGER